MNALLSFGYVLVGNELQSLLDGMGFDPYLGFYHQVDYGSPWTSWRSSARRWSTASAPTCSTWGC